MTFYERILSDVKPLDWSMEIRHVFASAKFIYIRQQRGSYRVCVRCRGASSPVADAVVAGKEEFNMQSVKGAS